MKIRHILRDQSHSLLTNHVTTLLIYKKVCLYICRRSFALWGTLYAFTDQSPEGSKINSVDSRHEGLIVIEMADGLYFVHVL